MNILIADNEIGILDSMKSLLEVTHEIETATNAIDALILFNSKHFDCVITDIDFGYGINGIELASEIRNCDPNVKLVVISAVDYSSDVRRRVIDVGAVFIEKPVKADELIRILEV